MECHLCRTNVNPRHAIEVINEWDNSHPVLCSEKCLKALKKLVGAKYILSD